jgi:hypothetical protein
MDSFEPAPTVVNGRVEAMTVSLGCFEGAGWLDPTARGHRNGATLIEDFRAALRHRPRFLHLHQFNEFAGQPEGAGVGPDHRVYVDTYSADLTDAFEPTSLTAPAYRSRGGWGYYYLNLVRALVDLYRQPTPETTVLAISQPVPAAPGHDIAPEVPAGEVAVKWVYAGRRPRAYALTVDGKVLAEGVRGDGATVDLSGIRPGRHMLRLTGEGTVARYRLSWTEDSLPLTEPEPAFAEAPITIPRGERHATASERAAGRGTSRSYVARGVELRGRQLPRPLCEGEQLEQADRDPGDAPAPGRGAREADAGGRVRSGALQRVAGAARG